MSYQWVTYALIKAVWPILRQMILYIAIFLILTLSACAPVQPVGNLPEIRIGTQTVGVTEKPSDVMGSGQDDVQTGTPVPPSLDFSTSTPANLSYTQKFNGQRAYRDVEYQVQLGPRTPGSQAHSQTVDWIVKELRAAGWEVDVQETQEQGQPVRNVVARWGEGQPWVIFGAHYDSRLLADHDPIQDNRSQAVPGANDGASGVAVLLEMGRVWPGWAQNSRFGQVWLVFFDAEDNGNLPGWQWILGSQAFVRLLDEKPDAAVIVDMIGDADLTIYKEMNSDPALVDQIWQSAHALGYSNQFLFEARHRILDDHIPFLQAGIPAVDLIDFDYPYWHTTLDTPDKVAPKSLKAVGDVLLNWLTGLAP